MISKKGGGEKENRINFRVKIVLKILFYNIKVNNIKRAQKKCVCIRILLAKSEKFNKLNFTAFDTNPKLRTYERMGKKFAS